LDIAFIHPTLTIYQPFHDSSFMNFLSISPKIYDYVGDTSQNPNIAKYRGFCDLRVLGDFHTWQLAVIGRLGNECNRGMTQIDLTIPLGPFLSDQKHDIDLAFDAQYFNGYGDTLLTYNQYTSEVRLGFSIYR